MRRLRDRFDGAVQLPGDAGYDAQRQALHPAIDARPAMVVEASTPADVRTAVMTASEHGLPLAVQATGHGTHVPADGAMARPGPEAGPVGHRTFSVILDASVPDLADALRPYATGGSFLNFLSDPMRTETTYTTVNYRRLREVKATYDPQNLFRLGHNIPPAYATQIPGTASFSKTWGAATALSG
jgi:Berberine and berberine like